MGGGRNEMINPEEESCRNYLIQVEKIVVFSAIARRHSKPKPKRYILMEEGDKIGLWRN